MGELFLKILRSVMTNNASLVASLLLWYCQRFLLAQRLAQFEPNTRSTTRLDKTISGVAFTRDGSTIAANYMCAAMCSNLQLG